MELPPEFLTDENPNIRCITNYEAYEHLSRRENMLRKDSFQIYETARNYSQSRAKTDVIKSSQIIDDLKASIDSKKLLTNYEISTLIDLQPNDVDEALEYLPSLIPRFQRMEENEHQNVELNRAELDDIIEEIKNAYSDI